MEKYIKIWKWKNIWKILKQWQAIGGKYRELVFYINLLENISY